ncbi:MAG: PEGA domain-containing protein [Acidobacteria bacterium]|nr:PEGA domain-containing protein [Acidobacteriota bacterium]
MTRPTLIVALVLALLSGAAVYLLRPSPEPEPAAPAEAPAAAPVVSAPARRAPRPAPAKTPAARSAPAAPPPAPAAAPAAPVEAAPAAGTLRIDSDVPGAQVFIDREFVGATPVTASGVIPGAHHLNVSAPGYDAVGEDLEVAAGTRDILVKFKEVRLDAAIAVVHRHRFGSCTGRLVATPQGMRYETADKDDAFTAALASLETFEVDYLKKNLHVKLRGGKGFDFTDPDGNADRLFVFHRDVEKARTRLAGGDPPAQPSAPAR